MTQTPRHSISQFLEIAAEWESEFARNKKEYGERIHCRRGCTDCCSQMFQITEIEAAYISQGVKRLPPKEREKLRERAREYEAQRERILTTRNVPDAWGSLPPPGLRLACPALEDGACRIYEYRPLICRKYGIPLYNPRKPDQLFACELNFSPGEELEVTELVQIQTAIQERWGEVQAEYNKRGGRRDPEPITVARAILEDFE
jgi:Fe-S-cluster containining protein